MRGAEYRTAMHWLLYGKAPSRVQRLQWAARPGAADREARLLHSQIGADARFPLWLQDPETGAKRRVLPAPLRRQSYLVREGCQTMPQPDRWCNRLMDGMPAYCAPSLSGAECQWCGLCADAHSPESCAEIAPCRDYFRRVYGVRVPTRSRRRGWGRKTRRQGRSQSSSSLRRRARKSQSSSSLRRRTRKSQSSSSLRRRRARKSQSSSSRSSSSSDQFFTPDEE